MRRRPSEAANSKRTSTCQCQGMPGHVGTVAAAWANDHTVGATSDFGLAAEPSAAAMVAAMSVWSARQ